jgi:adenosylcobinamide-GDP ribazoletransferase
VVHGRAGGRAVRDALRLAFGTLTILPVRPPGVVDRRTAARAMVLAPAVGLLLGLVAAALRWLLPATAAPLLAAVLVIGMLALLTRGMHLDGLADTADGLGARAPADQALALMRQGDIGPFGVVTVVLTLLLQVAALTQLVETKAGVGLLVSALVLSRLVLPLLCFERVPAARADGLGSSVAGSVGPLAATVAIGLTAGALTVAAVVAGPDLLHLIAAVLVPLAITGLLARHCVRRLGGITGDVLGACVEVTFTAALVVAAL